MGARLVPWLTAAILLPSLALLLLARDPLRAEPASMPAAASSPAAIQIYIAPPVQWDAPMFSSGAALQQTSGDLALLTGGVAFGMTPSAVNALLPEPMANLSWNTLQSANEYPGEVRYVWDLLSSLPALRDGITGCMGASSHVVFLFTSLGLFRLSFRLLPDASCPAPDLAARQLFMRFMAIGPAVALSVHYRTSDARVVDVTDPGASFLIPTRWRMSGN